MCEAVPCRSVSCIAVWGGREGQQRSKQARGTSTRQPMDLPDVAGVQCQQTQSSCQLQLFRRFCLSHLPCATSHLREPRCRSLRLFLPVRACRPNRPGSTWEVHGLEACCRKPSVQPCVRVLIVSFALFASPPCLVTVSVQEARGTLVCHAHVSKHLSAPEIQSDRTKQPATSRQTCPSTRRDKWALAAVPGNGCRQTALCRAASCLKRDWNSSPSRLGFDPGTLPAGPLDPDISFPWVILPWVGVFADGNRMLLDVAVRPKACIQHSFAHTLQQHSH